MASKKATKATERTFHYDGTKRRGAPKPSFSVTTTLTNAEISEALKANGSEFALKCVGVIEQDMAGFTPNANMMAWAVKLAEQGPNHGAMILSDAVQNLVAFRKPLKSEIDGHPFKVSLCGDRSKHCGSYAISNGGEFRSPDAEFYGYAHKSPAGIFEWTPTRACPAAIVAKLTE